MTKDSHVSIHGLTRSYRMGSTDVLAIDNLDLEIGRGEFLAVVGVSGSGKSTLLQLIGGLDTPTSGSIEVDGRDLARLSSYQRSLYRRTAVGFVFQSFHLVPSLSALANVAVALTFCGIYGRERYDRAAEALRSVGLEKRLDHRPGQLSGGEQQRVALARAMVNRPALLLADEPTGNLDRKTAAEVMNLVREINLRQEATVIMVTHDEEGARHYAGRVIHLSDGKIVSGSLIS
jgi:putative ABC transport system ATP-binding protein